MTKPLPKWLMERYAALWSEKKNQGFDFDDAANILNESNNKQTNVVLSLLRRHGWLAAEFNPNDARKRVYTLKDPEEVVGKIAEGQSTSYEDFKKAIKQVLTENSKGHTWTQIKKKIGLKQTVPNNKWVKQLEKEIKLKRERKEGVITWKI